MTKFVTGSLIRGREALGTAAVRNTGKSSVTHPAENVAQSHLMVVTTEHDTQSHLTIAIIDNITAPNTLTASMTQTRIPEQKRSLPTAVMSDIGVTILTIGAGKRAIGSATAAETDLVMIRPTEHPRLQTMPSS